MSEQNKPSNETFELMGMNYRQACIAKYCCFKMAQFMGGTEQGLCDNALETVRQIDHLTDFQAGVALALELGAEIPKEFLERANLTKHLPGSELH